MDGKTKTTATACIFVPHHTVRFYSGAALKSTMQICFHCGDIHWDAVQKPPKWLIPPDGLWTAILPLIKDAGFHMDREQEVWVARLEERKKAEPEK